ncbi:MAG: biotin synthase BioB [Candidatus Desantisbacteria bacterium]
MLNEKMTNIGQIALNGKDITDKEALFLVKAPLYELLFWANAVRTKFKKDKIDTCAIINAKSGKCSEDCKFCAQSSHYSTVVQSYPLVEEERILETGHYAGKVKAKRFGIVVSGRRLLDEEIDKICRAIKRLNRVSTVLPCASLGKLTIDYAERLKEAGLNRYHHNLETSERFFPNICTTHSYQERISTIKIAKDAGFEVCSGGIFGLGETWDDRVQLAIALRELGVTSIPLNFLNPIQGTPLGENKLLSPLEALRIIAIFRLIHPKQEIRIGGGREIVLRDIQSWIYYAGASGIMIGNYLTTPGRAPEENLQIIKDLELTIDE